MLIKKKKNTISSIKTLFEILKDINKKLLINYMYNEHLFLNILKKFKHGITSFMP